MKSLGFSKNSLMEETGCGTGAVAPAARNSRKLLRFCAAAAPVPPNVSSGRSSKNFFRALNFLGGSGRVGFYPSNFFLERHGGLIKVQKVTFRGL